MADLKGNPQRRIELLEICFDTFLQKRIGKHRDEKAVSGL